MAAAVGVPGDYDAVRLHELAKQSADAAQTRRLLALAAIYDGGAAAMPPGSAVLGCKRCGTGCWLSTPRGPVA
jgi:hypothetical protein